MENAIGMTEKSVISKNNCEQIVNYTFNALRKEAFKTKLNKYPTARVFSSEMMSVFISNPLRVDFYSGLKNTLNGTM